MQIIHQEAARGLKGVVSAVLELLLQETLGVNKLIINHFAILYNRHDIRIDKPAVRLEIQCSSGSISTAYFSTRAFPAA